MDGNGFLFVVYAVYILVAVGLTAWLARTLFRSGVAFLHDVFADKPELAEAVNRLLVVGFYMLNLGYGLYLLRADQGLNAFASLQFLVNRLSILLVVLGGIHFVNVFVFWRIRLHREQGQLPPPVAPHLVLPPPPAPAGT
jgi:hypothetical protein